MRKKKGHFAEKNVSVFGGLWTKCFIVFSSSILIVKQHFLSFHDFFSEIYFDLVKIFVFVHVIHLKLGVTKNFFLM